MNRHLLRTSVLAFGLALALVGCGKDTLRPEEPEIRVYPPRLHAITAPESVAVGDSVTLVVHVAAGGCLSPEPIRLESSGPRHRRATILAREAVDALCPANVDYASLTVRMKLDEPGSWTIDVVGADTARAVVEVGSAPRHRGIHRLAIEPRNGESRPSGVELMWQTPEPSRQWVVIDSTGHGQYELPCESGAIRSRYVIIFSGFSFYRFGELPEDCAQTVTTRIFR